MPCAPPSHVVCSAVVLSWVLLAAAETNATERHPALGMVLDIDVARKSLIVSCPEIPGFMKAKVAALTVRGSEELAGLPKQGMIDFTLVADGGTFRAENLRVHRFASAEPQPLSAGRLELLEALTSNTPKIKALEPGDAVPDFSLIDQERRSVRLSELSGKVVALSFMYTRCRVASYCFRLSNNLGVLRDRFSDRLARDLVLLTVTFDPTNDAPETLAEYAATWKADGKSWHFLTGPEAEVRRVCHMFGMNFWADMGMITHTMHTVVIDRQGHVAADLEGNEFTPQQLGDLVEFVLDRSRPVS